VQYSKTYFVTFIAEFLQTFTSPQTGNSLPQVRILLVIQGNIFKEVSNLNSQSVLVLPIGVTP